MEHIKTRRVGRYTTIVAVEYEYINYWGNKVISTDFYSLNKLYSPNNVFLQSYGDYDMSKAWREVCEKLDTIYDLI